MTARRRWLVAYDIRDDRRLRAVHDVVRCYGAMLQYSVYLCDLTPIEKFGLMVALRDVINHFYDSVVFIDLGEPSRTTSATIEFMGQSVQLPHRGATIV
ncbi:MAG: CRISPR-associated endonuclease Cas2 [Acidimicrobiales bacterium]|nr:CRISPR-associated endonuclease Cas2 [Acidimicrobiales bacterium]